jgi:hypothetical protein
MASFCSQIKKQTEEEKSMYSQKNTWLQYNRPNYVVSEQELQYSKSSRQKKQNKKPRQAEGKKRNMLR